MDLISRPTFLAFIAALVIGFLFSALLKVTQNRMPLWPILYGLLIMTMIASYVLVFGYDSWLSRWTIEDQLVEWATFWMAILAACFAGAAAWRAKPRRAGLLSIGLAALSILLAGEEISWGQRKLGITTPDAIAKFNHQNELNFHNLEIGGILIGDMIQAATPLLLLLGFFIWQGTFRRAADTYAGFKFHPQVVIISLILAGFFLVSHTYAMPLFDQNFLLVQDISLADIPTALFRLHSHNLAELSEALFASFMLLAAIAFWRRFEIPNDVETRKKMIIT